MAAPHVMIDIESMALTPDALVLSIGASKFDLEETGPVTPDPDFFVVPDFLEQVARARHVERGTQMWWSRQGQAVSAHWRNPNKVTPVEEALLQLSEFVAGAKTIWAKGPQFDIVVLEDLFRVFGHKVPWDYRIIRDVRTVVLTAKTKRPLPSVPIAEDMPHHPLGDCRIQIRELWMHGQDLSL